MRRIGVLLSATVKQYGNQARVGALRQACAPLQPSRALCRCHWRFYRRCLAILGMNARRSGKLSTCLSDPEIIHAGKNKRVLGLKNVPKIEVDHGPVEGKLLSEMLEDMTSEFEAEKFQLVLT